MQEKPEEGPDNFGLELRWAEGKSPGTVAFAPPPEVGTAQEMNQAPSQSAFPKGYNDTTDFPLIKLRARKGVHSYC